MGAMVMGMTVSAGEETKMGTTMGVATMTRTTTTMPRRKEHVKNADTMFLIVAKTLKHAKRL